MKAPTPKPSYPAGLSIGSARYLGIALVYITFLASGLPFGGNGVAAAGKTSAAPSLLWQTMRGLNFQTGEMTPELGKFINAIARVPGYMVPLEDSLNEVTEFLLVPYPGACIHVPPPPPNQLVHVTMDSGKTTSVKPFWEPVWVQGIVTIAEVKNSYGAVSFFQMTATQIDPYKDTK
jgi:uncharacterized protein